MAARAPPGGRPGGARFAQFKLVLLGMSNHVPKTPLHHANCIQVNLLLEKYLPIHAKFKFGANHIVEFTGAAIRKSTLDIISI